MTMIGEGNLMQMKNVLRKKSILIGAILLLSIVGILVGFMASGGFGSFDKANAAEAKTGTICGISFEVTTDGTLKLGNASSAQTMTSAFTSSTTATSWNTTTLGQAVENINRVEIVGTINPYTSGITVSFAYMFRGLAGVTEIVGLDKLNT